jgi:serine/threonine protein kinase
MPTAAHRLVGVPLADGWIASKLLVPDPSVATGGVFSVGYEAVHADGSKGFLKALDFPKAFGTADPAFVLQTMTTAFIFERDALEVCKRKSLDRVVAARATGTVSIPSFAVSAVPYLIFDMADGDVRKHLSAAASFDLAWRYTCLQHVATGLKQLHGAGIAHQDLKPSNVLTYSAGSESRIGDLGRASRAGIAAPHDHAGIAGDKTYAPPELLYNHIDPDWSRRRLGCDLYHLGSLIMFFFSQANFTHCLVSALDPAIHPNSWTGRYEDVLPHVRDAFNRVLGAFESDCRRVAPKSALELVLMVRQLCDPDPTLRGDLTRRNSVAQYSLERFISRFNLLAYNARLGKA